VRPCLTDRDRRFNIRGRQASCSGSRSEEFTICEIFGVVRFSSAADLHSLLSMYLPPTADQRPTRSRHVQLPHEESSRRSLSSAAQGTRAASIATPLVVANEPSDFLAYGFYGGGAAATFCRAAKRGIDMTHPRARSGACNCGSYLDVAQDVAAADDHGALLADQADKEHDKQQSPYRSGPNRGYTKGSLGRHVYEHMTSAYQHLLLPARLLGLLFGRSFDSFPSRAPGTSFDDS